MIRFAALPWNRAVAAAFAAALSAFLLLAVPVPASADAPKTHRMDDGSECFRATLAYLRFKPLKSFAELDPANSILIMLGDTRRLSEVPGGLQQFLSDGGAALIASDLPMQADAKRALIDTTGVAISGFQWARPGKLEKAQAAQEQAYRQIEYCPYMEPYLGDRADLRLLRHPSQDRLVKVATNLPSTLEGGPWPFRVLPFAKLPDSTEFLVPNDHANNFVVWLFGVAGDVGAGRIVLLADHSIFINEMMNPADNDNLEFTANCLTYLSGDRHQRKRVLFVDNDRIYETFPASPKGPTADLAARLLSGANSKLTHVQDRLNEFDKEDGFNQKTSQFLSRFFRSPRQLFSVALILGTLMLLIYACYRLGIASVHKKEAALASLARIVGQQGPPGPLLALRHEGMVGAANIAEAGRQLARDAFEAAGVAAPVPYREPVVTITGVGRWRGLGLRRRVLQLWRLAFHRQPPHLAPHAVRALVAELEQLKADLKRGTIQLT